MFTRIKSYAKKLTQENISIKSTMAAGALSALCLSGAMAQAQTVPIAVGIDPTFVSFFVAKDQDLFQKHGVDVKLVTFGPGGAMVDGMMAGQAVMTASTETTHLIRMPHADIRPVGIVGESGDNLKLVSRAEITDPAQIKTYGVVPGGVFEYLTSLSTEKFNGTDAKLAQVKSGPPELPALLLRGDVDAFWLFEPFPTMVKRQGGNILASSKDVGYTYATWVSAMGPWLESNPEQAKKVLDALAEACEITTADPALAAAAVEKQVRIPKQQTLEFLRETQCQMRGFTEEDLNGYDRIADFLQDRKITTQRVSFRDKVAMGFYP
ncbi:ABC transporter substrate-binding protein [Providencia rettgeri]|uniref:ABC transporter substrate-binding protein n=1 Tax=Alcaligenes sp. SORT26 TaxID=2813780 RepID=UPI001A9FAA51|nr:ABC transporter substrate-binding protein [Alcaligenes sp. SORT26]MBY6345859.1 ABC transporter substrate-binding protein [Providencia rettgeri]QTB99444.1 ABC transporter substrate-binding protein [Alcaligenes sp. SORT26]